VTNHRPIIDIPKTPLEMMLNVLSFLLIAGNILYILWKWSILPEQIPVHFNAVGEVDGWGNRGMIWLLPAITLFLWISMTVLEKYPHVYNYLNLTAENAERQYKNARIMLNVLKAEITAFFVYLDWQSIQVALSDDTDLGKWDMFIFLGVIICSLAVFVIRSVRLK
jgi:hypothetical protein